MIVRALIVLLLWFVGFGLAAAQDQEPRITFELSSDEVIVGQPIELRIKILVPTWMLSPAQYPSLEQPNLLVRLPERASSPTSETINGETWSGIIQSYQIYPLSPGQFEIPARTLTITYADPSSQKPIVLDQTLASVSFTGTMPSAARDLKPPILAQDFKLEQSIDEVAEIAVGDAITRTVTATIDGTTPILIPLLIPPLKTEIIRDYPKEANVTEQEDRGTLSGSRTEVVTYVAQAGGQVALPPIVMDWFNVKTGKVEQAKLDGINVSVTAPPVVRHPLSPQLVARYAGFALAAALVFWMIMRFALPVIRARVYKANSDFRASETYAFRQLHSAVDAHALDDVLTALDNWLEFYPSDTITDADLIRQALQTIGQDLFGNGSKAGDASLGNWHNLKQSCSATRKVLRQRLKSTQPDRSLPPLNP